MGKASGDIPAPARLRLDGAALVANWRTLNDMSGSATAGAAVKANAYGLGAQDVTQRLMEAGCRDFYVANWQEAAELESIVGDDAQISVLNGVQNVDMIRASRSAAKPVLNSLDQVARWKDTGRPCDLMIDTGMNRLGLDPADLGGTNLEALDIDIVMSHLASADEDVAQNAEQLGSFHEVLTKVSGKRISFANSAGIALGPDYHFDATRPGLALYGGKPRPELETDIQQVAFPECQIVQVRQLQAGDKLGYNARYVAKEDHLIAIVAMGYADGYLRAFSESGYFVTGESRLSVLGRISMDLTAIDIRSAPDLQEGDWVGCNYDLSEASAGTGLSQYELLTNLGERFDRKWID